MRKHWKIGLVLLALLAFSLAGVAWAASASGAGIDWDVLASGGGPSSTSRVSLNTTLGQTAIGHAASPSNMGSGYWSGELNAADRSIYLPMLTRHQ